ncbi:MAG: 50S ribosomal protein L10 [Patescibacteria group bacterium]|jgi:large subunit ribosomal protein L10
MPKTRSKKAAIIGSLEEKAEKMKSAVFINYSGIPVKEIDVLRNKCRDEGAEYMATKKTLLKNVLKKRGISEIDSQELSGEIATVFGYEDEIAPARIVAGLAKENNKLKFIGGIFEGNYIDAVKVTELSKIPSRKELLSKLVGCLSNPLSGIVRVINAIKESKEGQAV